MSQSDFYTEGNEEIEFNDVIVVAYTDAAFLLKQIGQDDDDAEWFPKSQIDWTMPAERGDRVTVYVPRWLAGKKGWD